MTCRCKCVCVCSSWCVFCVCLFVWSLWPFTFTYSSFSVIIFKKTKISKNHLYFSYQRLVWVKKVVSEIIFLETFFPSDLLWDIQITFVLYFWLSQIIILGHNILNNWFRQSTFACTFKQDFWLPRPRKSELKKWQLHHADSPYSVSCIFTFFITFIVKHNVLIWDGIKVSIINYYYVCHILFEWLPWEKYHVRH